MGTKFVLRVFVRRCTRTKSLGRETGRPFLVTATNDVVSVDIVRHPNGWCSAPAVQAVSLSEALHYLYFPEEVVLDEFEDHPNYVYFNGSYVGVDIVWLKGQGRETQLWQFLVSKDCVQQTPEWKRTELWRVDYRCPFAKQNMNRKGM